ncbi:DUF6174 domain-containing protein [Conexibacter woesei]|uniref:Uncharacterized protein n=1 Tax=Conexibacter woesei (strain DSM 14684 / CCUG 47730 / CIP 108061 / JCM 11494 / NBRC 100937 / ID131577) TaxID=469383 RepID=D3F9I2_CONWI|nr:DUF6174 domain-containing protein [Conexibacter woesei]ADB49149.1 hypothetical protein Cwoe_0716 [Conexibacter woesei DSM 14684]
MSPHRRPRAASTSLAAALAVAALFAAAAALALATTPASAPAATPPGPDGKPDARILDGTAQRNLDAARERWHALGATSYRMRVRVQCFCPREITRPRTLAVRRGKPVAPVPEHLRPYATVSRLFARVQEAIDARVAALTAEYTATGVPRTIFVDRSFMIADEERGVGVDRFSR